MPATDEYVRSYQNARRRARRARPRVLVEALALEGDLLCDSHTSDDEKRQIINRMFKNVLELMKMHRGDVDNFDSLGTILFQSMWRTENMPSIVRDGNMISMRGDFDIRELAKNMVWGDVAKDMRLVMDESEED